MMRAALPLVLAALSGPAMAGGLIASVETDKARYAPGEAAAVTVTLAAPASVTLTLRQRGQALPGVPALRAAGAAAGPVTFTLAAPGPDFQGYMLDVQAASGAITDAASGALDVSSDWRRFPRECFLTRFTAGADAGATLRAMVRRGCNAAQFYDVDHRHEAPYSPDPSWPNLSNTVVDRATVQAMIGAAHARNVLALHYRLMDGAYPDAVQSGAVPLAWGSFLRRCLNDCHIYDLDATPANPFAVPAPLFPPGWAAPALLLMDPNNADWRGRWQQGEQQVVAAFAYDGTQVDTLGAPYGPRWDWQGRPSEHRAGLARFAAEAAAATGRRVVLNGVSQWGQLDTAGNAALDAIYSELWDVDAPTYANLNRAAMAVRLVTAKGFMSPGYMQEEYYAARYGCTLAADPGCHLSAPGVKLAESAFALAGSYHVAWVDGDRYTSNIYVPGPMLAIPPVLEAWMADLAAMQVGYQNVLRAGVTDAVEPASLAGAPSSADGRPGTVWLQAKARPGMQVLHLVNFVGVTSDDYKDHDATREAPVPQGPLRVRLHHGGTLGPRSRVWLASPDIAHGQAQDVAFVPGADVAGPYVDFTVPGLAYWTMAVLELGNLSGAGVAASQPLRGSGFTQAAGGVGAARGDLLNGGSGRWATWEMVSLGAPRTVQVEAAAPVGAGVEVHLDGPAGPLVASGRLPPTRSLNARAVLTLPVAGVSGTHDVTLVFPDNVAQVRSLAFGGGLGLPGLAQVGAALLGQDGAPLLGQDGAQLTSPFGG